MRRVDLFKDPEKYDEMIGMLKSGMPYIEISRHFQCDPTTVRSHARKLGLRDLTRRPPMKKEVLRSMSVQPTEEDLNSIDTRLIKKHCVLCWKPMEKSKERYWKYGNFCPTCTAAIKIPFHYKEPKLELFPEPKVFHDRTQWSRTTIGNNPVYPCRGGCGKNFIKTRGPDQEECLICMGLKSRIGKKIKKWKVELED